MWCLLFYFIFYIYIDYYSLYHKFNINCFKIGKLVKGKEGTFDATFVMLDDDFVQLAAGKLNGQSAFMTVREFILLVYFLNCYVNITEQMIPLLLS